MIKHFKWLFLATSVLLVACSDDDNDGVEIQEPLTAGSADFSKYVALGNSLTAGFSDNALFRRGQENSYPKLMAEQFALVGGGEFKVPYLGADNLGGLTLMGQPIQGTRYVIQGFQPNSTTPIVGPLPVAPVNEISTPLAGGPFQNMGVPGAKLYHLAAPGYGNLAGVPVGQANPYFARFASSSSTSVISDAVAQNPTFFSLWIGNNDVLGYATAGGTGLNQTGNSNVASYGSNDITDPQTFQQIYASLVNALTANGAKGVVANIPYVYTVPYFTTVPTHPLTLTALGGGNAAVGEATVDQLNQQLIGPIRQVLAAVGQEDRIQLLSKTTANPVLIKDEALTDLSAVLTQALTPALGVQTATFVGQTYGQARHAKMSTNPLSRDYLVLTSQSVIGTNVANVPEPFNKLGVTYPMQDQWVLTQAETAEVKTATDAYNVAIKDIADAKGLAFVDANTALQQLATGGIRFGNHHLTASYVVGGMFSLDGVHPSGRGYAFISNRFMQAINATYGSNFRDINIGAYPIQYPANLN